MFGYIIPDKPNMYIKDFAVFKAFYCGLCKSIGKECNEIARFTTNYDMTFFNILMHNILNHKVEFSNEACILNPLNKRPVVVNNTLTTKIVHVNILMMYYKLFDDVIDDKSFKAKSLLLLVKPKAKKAKKLYPEIDRIIKDNYNLLRELEKVNTKSIDRVSEPFGIIIRDIAKIIAKDKDNCYFSDLCYNIGKWVYLMDALDDLEQDFKSKNYNPFLATYPDFINREEYLKKHQKELNFHLNSTYNSIVNNYNQLDFKVSEGVLSNIIYLGMKKQTNSILKGETKCKMTHL